MQEVKTVDKYEDIPELAVLLDENFLQEGEGMSNDDFTESELRHIEMIESVIVRMGQNSFAIKGWTMTLIVAICGLSAVGAEKRFAFLAIVPILVFWVLDSFYLQRERNFRELYNRAIEHDVPAFSMDIASINGGRAEYLNCFISFTERTFYLACIVTIVIFIWFI